MNTILQMKANFFDRPVQRAVDAAAADVLAKFGASVRKGARWSLKESDNPSAPGSPPHTHSGKDPITGKRKFNALKDLITYAYEPSTKSVVIGPPLSSHPTGAPKRLEFGGMLPMRPNKRRAVRKVGGAGEIRIGGAIGKNTNPSVNWKKKTVDVTYAHIYTAEQARRANELNEELYGPMMLGGAVAKRAFMGPALQINQDRFAGMFGNTVHAA